MAETDVRPDHIKQVQQDEQQGVNQNLKYLGFVHVAAIQVLLCLSRFYAIAKENSGSLKPGVQTVEGTVKSVVGPVYDKYHGIPFEILNFVDRKVGEAVGWIGHNVPSLMEAASAQVYSAAQKAPEVARSVSCEFQRAGFISTASGLGRAVFTKVEPAAKELYGKYEPVAEKYAVAAWRSLNRLPVFPQVAQVLVPTAAHWSDRYNKAVVYSASKGYAVSSYLPLVPVEKIAKVFRERKASKSE